MADDTEKVQESGVRVAPGEGGRRPQYGETGVSLAEIVRTCHEVTIDEGLARLELPGFDRNRLDAVLTYCAELRCEADRAVCPGCRRETLAAGFETLDAYVAAHRRIEIGSSVVEGGGTLDAGFPSFDAMTRGWAGEEYWFWARRVLRKHWHGIRRAHIQGSAVAPEGATPAVILMEPQLAENIGMVARAMANFGLTDLRLVAPRDGWPNEKARIAASGANYVIDDARHYPTLEASLGDLNWVCATTARQRDLRKPVLTPEQAVAEIRIRIARGERCGMLFGRERNGLETGEVANADAIVMIPVNSRFASLNLAQAVQVLAWELRRAALGVSGAQPASVGTPEAASADAADPALVALPEPDAGPPATHEQLERFHAHFEQALIAVGFLDPATPRKLMPRMRRLFARAGLRAEEVDLLRGVCKQMLLAAEGRLPGRRPPVEP